MAQWEERCQEQIEDMRNAQTNLPMRSSQQESPLCPTPAPEEEDKKEEDLHGSQVDRMESLRELGANLMRYKRRVFQTSLRAPV